MLAQAQGILSNSAGSLMGAGSATKALVGAHPLGLGIAVGLGAYFIIDKYWLNKEDIDEEEAIDEAASTEATA